jgi:hypothetical protein
MENDNSRQNMERGDKIKQRWICYWIDTTITPLSMNKEDRISMLQPNLSLNAKAEMNLEMQNKTLVKINKELDRLYIALMIYVAH